MPWIITLMDNAFHSATDAELKKVLMDKGYWTKMHNNQLLEKIRSSRPAVIAPGGISQIVSYWDEHLQYLCTVHRVIDKDGVTVHEDVKDASIDGTRYRTG
jgi:hypothetical protein